jgi:uncharacterized protein (TIGR02147 family)
MKKIFEYFEYRDFLRDHFEHSKEEKPFFSFRYITQKTGIDAGYYVRILNKQKHLGAGSIEPMIRFLKLKKREGEYFRVLIDYNKAKRDDQAKLYFERLLAIRECRLKTLEKSAYDYFSDWYNIPLRELLNVYSFKGQDYGDLGRQLSPPISAVEARKSMVLLKRLGLVKKAEDGTWRPKDALITTGDQQKDAAIENFQRDIMRIGAEAIERLPRSQRDMSTLTLSTSMGCMRMIQDRLNRVRKEILDLVQSEEEVDGVYQLNFQMFRLSGSDTGEAEDEQ